MSETWDPRYKYASRVSDVLVSVAEQGFALELDNQTKARWAEIMMLMREVDTKADSTPSEEILAELSEFIDFYERYPNLTAVGKDSPMQNELLSQAEKILRTGKQMAHASTPLRYLAFRRREAIQTAHVFLITASDKVREQKGFGDQFIPMLARVAVASSYFDDFLDATSDYRRGTIAFKPTPAFRATLLRETVKEVARDGKSFLAPQTIKQFAKMCLVGRYSHYLQRRQAK